MASRQFTEHAIDLAWSLWTELGVAGWQRRHSSYAIDPETLILFTAYLGDADPRLRDESSDWCVRYWRLVSTTRLKAFLKQAPPEVGEAFGEYAATIGAHCATRWPLASHARTFTPTKRAQIGDDLARPALVVLRLRALFGVTARAEIVKAFLADPTAEQSASRLADDAGYTRRHLSETLDGLHSAGLLEVVPRKNQLWYRLTKPAELLSLVGRLPDRFPPWRPTFTILTRLRTMLARAEELEPLVLRVELDLALRELQPFLRDAGCRAPVTDSTSKRSASGQPIGPHPTVSGRHRSSLMPAYRWATDLGV